MYRKFITRYDAICSFVPLVIGAHWTQIRWKWTYGSAIARANRLTTSVTICSRTVAFFTFDREWMVHVTDQIISNWANRAMIVIKRPLARAFRITADEIFSPFEYHRWSMSPAVVRRALSFSFFSSSKKFSNNLLQSIIVSLKSSLARTQSKLICDYRKAYIKKQIII